MAPSPYGVCVCEREGERVCVSVSVIIRKRGEMSCVFVSVHMRNRDSVCVCVC